MLNFKEIEKFYPLNQQPFKRNLLREYLQHKILLLIFSSVHSYKLSFMGGTCLRIVHNNSRFSEDLDFDNFNLTQKDFSEISVLIKKGLELEGYKVEIKNVFKAAFRCYVRMPEILFDNRLSGYEEEKILIQLDTEPQRFNYNPEKYILNKFDVFTQIFITPVDILLSQKLWAILNRKVPKGRDFFDVVFLWSFAKPNYKYLKEKASITDLKNLKAALLKKVGSIDLGKIANDVKPFLINSMEINKILLFKEFVESLKINIASDR